MDKAIRWRQRYENLKYTVNKIKNVYFDAIKQVHDYFVPIL